MVAAMSSYLNADKTYLTLTPAGIFEAFSQSESTDEQLALQIFCPMSRHCWRLIGLNAILMTGCSVL